MAVASPKRDPLSSGVASPRSGLLDHAISLLVDHVAGPRIVPGGWRFGPLVIVSAAEDAAVAAVSRGTPLAATDVAAWPGEVLGRELVAALADDRFDRLAATLSATRLVVVDRIDRVAGDEAQEALAHLFDATTAAGVTWCVSVATMPATGPGPRCATRLGAGLVVAAPPMPNAAVVGTIPSLVRVMRAAARHHDVPVDAILGPARRRTVAAARSLAMYLARRLTGHSLQAIGDACGGRDHTTVLHGVRVCAARIARDPAFAADVDRLVAELSGAARPGDAGRRRSGVGSAALSRSLAGGHPGRRRKA